MFRFCKYQALGNDYLVLDPKNWQGELKTDRIQRLCDRHYGVGSDGILWGPMIGSGAGFRLRIFNPDGSEAEKSGNGLRIFARYLWDKKLVNKEYFVMETPGGNVRAQVLDQDKCVRVEMGRLSFDSRNIPVTGPEREVLNETIEIKDKPWIFCAATIGNPHCVVLTDNVSAELARQIGPLIETDPRFPNRTNVQFMKVLDRKNIQLEIWERGAGYTLASGSSSCAAAGAACKLGLCDRDITVHMPGGALEITIEENYEITLTGPVAKVAEGFLSEEVFHFNL
jgi:diaminopimelate epimerase